jgi:hypothetical protein
VNQVRNNQGLPEYGSVADMETDDKGNGPRAGYCEKVVRDREHSHLAVCTWAEFPSSHGFSEGYEHRWYCDTHLKDKRASLKKEAREAEELRAREAQWAEQAKRQEAAVKREPVTDPAYERYVKNNPPPEGESREAYDARMHSKVGSTTARMMTIASDILNSRETEPDEDTVQIRNMIVNASRVTFISCYADGTIKVVPFDSTGGWANLDLTDTELLREAFRKMYNEDELALLRKALEL